MDQLTLRWYGHACFTVTAESLLWPLTRMKTITFLVLLRCIYRQTWYSALTSITIITLQVWSNRLLAIRIRFIS